LKLYQILLMELDLKSRKEINEFKEFMTKNNNELKIDDLQV